MSLIGSAVPPGVLHYDDSPLPSVLYDAIEAEFSLMKKTPFIGR